MKNTLKNKAKTLKLTTLGFTLIELLAVIVILAIIAVIATPIILGVIDDAREKSYVNSAHGIVDAANKFIVTTQLTGNLNNRYEFDLTTDELNYSGGKPSSGTLLIDRLQNVSMTLKYDNYCIEKKFDESEPTIKNKSNCIIDSSEIQLSKNYKERILNGTDPVISGDLVPVTIEQTSNNYIVRKASVESNYYSYSSKIWANAIIPTSAAASAVNALAVGAQIEESQIESYFVWIPRYRYQLFNTNDTGDFGTKTNETYVNKAQTIKIEFENKNTNPSSGSTNGEWLTHPAFTSFNVNGMWVGKFETGYKSSSNLNTNNPTNVQIKSDITSWRNIQVANAYLTSYNYKRALDSHMMKNSEWGAVAYLSQSVYGINGNIRMNNNSSYKTGYAALNESTCGYTDSMSTCNVYGEGLQFNSPFFTNIGILASTTGNITGIYDMVGGAWELVMGILANSSGTPYSGRHNVYNSGFNGPLGRPDLAAEASGNTAVTSVTGAINFPEAKYYDKYLTDSMSAGMLGDATKEMGPFGTYSYSGVAYNDGVAISGTRYVNSWYFDDAYFVNPGRPWFIRGGLYLYGSHSGVFHFHNFDGNANGARSFRLVLAPNA